MVVSNEEKVAHSLLHVWKIALSSKRKTKEHINSNFNELVCEWHENGVSDNIASSLFKEAIEAHCPTIGLSKKIYSSNVMIKNSYESVMEYHKSWCAMIEDFAYNVYYTYYPPIKKVQKKKANYGSMSKQEYMMQKAYAESYPTVNIAEVIKKRSSAEIDNILLNEPTKSSSEYDVTIDLESL